VPFVLAVTGLLLTWWLATKVTTDRVCVRLIVWSYVAKIVLAMALYYPALYQWPIFPGYHGGDGFWVFADDAELHHTLGWRLVDAWKGNGAFPRIDVGNWSFPFYVAVLYYLLGVHPLSVSFLNAWYGTGGTVAGLFIMQRLGAEPLSRRLGVLVLAFWPSLLLWASQPMKDQAILTLVMVGLALLMSLVDGRERRTVWLFGLASCFWLTIVPLQLLRGYTALALTLTAVAAFTVLAVRALMRRSLGVCGRFLVLVPMTALVLVLASKVDFKTIFGPAEKEETSSLIAESMLAPSSPEQALMIPSSSGGSQSAVAVQSERPFGSVGRHLEGLVSKRLEELEGFRRGFISTGGNSLIDEEIRLQRLGDALDYLPRALSVAFLGPFPWQWFDTSGSTRWFRSLTAIEMVLIYLLLIGFVARSAHLRWYAGRHIAIILLFATIVAVPMCLSVPNIGTLFRLRLQFLLPLFLLVCLVGVPGVYRRTATWLWSAISRRRKTPAVSTP